MIDSKRTILAGRAVPLRGNDIDTDRIIPARYLRTVTFDGLGEHAFEDDREALKKAGQVHVFDEPKYAEGQILVVNKNFGCGSSREHAPQSIIRWGKGIVAIVGESFAEIFYGNCISLGVPCPTVSEATAQALQSAIEADPSAEVSVDLLELKVRVGSQVFPCEMPEGPRQQFVEGRWDTTGELLASLPEIKATVAKLPYFGNFAG